MHSLTLAVSALWLFGAVVLAQEPAPATPAPKPPEATLPKPKPQEQKQDPAQKEPAPKQAAAGKAFDQERLEQIVAPIALYTDALLAQVLMASTYPLEVVEASRWQKKNSTLKGDALEKALQSQDWDASVKALCGVPAVLTRMNDNLDWTQDLGDAFLADKNALMQTVQTMRRKALESGNLKTTKEQKVEEREDKVIVIESTNTEVVYVPTYYPTAVYGGWYYPHYHYPGCYPPYPPGYPAFTFAVGVAWGACVWGGCNWGNDCDVNIDIDKQNNFNNRTGNREQRDRAAQKPAAGNRGKFQHDASHRKGVGYRDSTTAKQFGGSGTSNRVSRDQARGYSPSQGAAGNRAGTGNTAGTRPSTGNAGTRPSTGNAGTRPSTGNSGARTNRTSTSNTKSSGQRSSSFSGSKSSSSTRAASSRGSASRGSASRGGGGGARGGGGGRGGGGRR